MIDVFGNIFESMLEMYNATFEIYIGNQLANSQEMQAPKEILTTNFVQLIKQIKNDKRPLRIKMVVPNVIWDEFEKKQKSINNEACVSNNAMIEWLKSKERTNENECTD